MGVSLPRQRGGNHHGGQPPPPEGEGTYRYFCNYLMSKKTKHSSLDLWYSKNVNTGLGDRFQICPPR